MAVHMSCQEFVELVTSYLDDAMDADTRQRFEEHLVLCPGCVTYVEQFRATIEQLGDAQPPSLSATTMESLMDAFRTWHR